MIKFCYTHQCGWYGEIHQKRRLLVNVECTDDEELFVQIFTMNESYIIARKQEFLDSIEYIDDMMESYGNISDMLELESEE